MKSKKGLIAVIAVILITIGVLVGMVLTKDFDAEKYVSVVLDQTFRGEVEGATEIIDGVTEEELYQQYEEGVTAFVKNNIIIDDYAHHPNEIKSTINAINSELVGFPFPTLIV